MLDILRRLLIYLGPFIKEIFFKNDELKDEVLKPSFMLKTVIVILTIGSALAFLFQLTSSSLIETHSSYRELSTDYSTLNKENQVLMVENRRLEHAVAILKEKVLLIEVTNEELVTRYESCTKDNIGLSETCTSNSSNIENNLQKERASINERLNDIDF